MSYSDTFEPSGLPHWVYPNDKPTFQDIDTAMEICNNKFNDISQESTSLSTDVNSNEVSIQRLEVAVDTAKNSIKALQDLQVEDRGDIGTNAVNISKLQGDYNSVESNLTATKELLDSTISDLNRVESSVQTNTTNINNLSGEVVQLKDDVNNVDNKLNPLMSKICDNVNYTGDYVNYIQQNSAIEATISNNAATFASINTAVTNKGLGSLFFIMVNYSNTDGYYFRKTYVEFIKSNYGFDAIETACKDTGETRLVKISVSYTSVTTGAPIKCVITFKDYIGTSFVNSTLDSTSKVNGCVYAYREFAMPYSDLSW